MAAIRWTLGARRNLREIVTYIQRDSSVYAAQVAERLLAAVDRLEQLPKLGRVVPEYQDAALRELLVGHYRVIYRVQSDSIGIIALIHASRDLLRHLPATDWKRN